MAALRLGAFVIASFALCARLNIAAAVSLTASFVSTAPKNTVDPRFINVNIDSGSLYNGLDLYNPKLRNLAMQLAPVLVRVGGTSVDYSFYHPATPYKIGQVNGDASGNVAIGNALLDALALFANATGAEIVYNFNGLSFRSPATGPWNVHGNATPILDYIQSKYAGQKFSWSVGNEPNHWTVAVTAAQLAADTVTLKNALTTGGYSIGTDVYGPSLGGFVTTFISSYIPVAKSAVKGFTFHDFPYSAVCDLTSLLNKSPISTTMAASMQAVATIAAGDSLPAGTLLVVEQTAAAYAGGCPNVTDRFFAGFVWLPLINAVANSGFHRLHRQDLVGWSTSFEKSQYQLVGTPGWTNGSATMTPHPDWYTTILAKQILGQKVLTTTVTGATSAAYDALVWCASGVSGGVAVAWTNLGGTDTVLSLGATLDAQSRIEYTLTSTAADYSTSHVGVPLPLSVHNDSVYLNGVLMTVDPVTALLPQYPIPGKTIPAGSSALLTPAYAYGFAVYPNAAAAACVFGTATATSTRSSTHTSSVAPASPSAPSTATSSHTSAATSVGSASRTSTASRTASAVSRSFSSTRTATSSHTSSVLPSHSRSLSSTKTATSTSTSSAVPSSSRVPTATATMTSTSSSAMTSTASSVSTSTSSASSSSTSSASSTSSSSSSASAVSSV